MGLGCGGLSVENTQESHSLSSERASAEPDGEGGTASLGTPCDISKVLTLDAR